MALPLALIALIAALAALALAAIACVAAHDRLATGGGFNKLQRNALRVYVAKQVAEQIRRREPWDRRAVKCARRP